MHQSGLTPWVEFTSTVIRADGGREDSVVLFYGYQLKSIIFGCRNHKFLMQFSTHSYHAAENDMHANK